VPLAGGGRGFFLAGRTFAQGLGFGPLNRRYPSRSGQWKHAWNLTSSQGVIPGESVLGVDLSQGPVGAPEKH